MIQGYVIVQHFILLSLHSTTIGIVKCIHKIILLHDKCDINW